MTLSPLSILVEIVRPQIKRFAPFNFCLEMGEVHTTPGHAYSIELSSPIFGGLKATADLNVADFALTNAKRLENEVLSRIEKAIQQIEDEAELIAVVDYKWPKAA